MSNFTVFPPCLRSAFGAIALMSLMAVGHAQTAEQLEIFQSLPPEQQRTILEALGRSQETMTTSPEPSRSTRDPDLVLPVTRDEEEIDEGPNARLWPYDTLLIELRLVENAGAERVLVKPPPTPNGPTGIPPTAPAPAQPAAQSTPPPANQSESRLKDERTALQRERLDKFREEVRKGNPFRLDANGFLELPGLRPIMLSGLTAYEAAQRLAAEPFLKDFAIDLIRLPVAHAGADGLKPFGYDLFRGIATTFAPASDIPVPAEYVLGPGDRVRVQLIGNTRGNYQLEVNRDGTINFPDLGPISVAGLRFDDARTMIEERVTQQMIGVRASVSLGELRSIRVFVLGESEQPGSYTVSGLSTITNALFVSGGVKPIGSLRDVQLKRGGRTVARLDLYDLLLRGDTSRDVRLQPGDAIFIPPVGVTVGLKPPPKAIRSSTVAERGTS